MTRTRGSRKEQTIHNFIQNAVIAAINDPSFNFELPELKQSTWHNLIRPFGSRDELERLEFVGDALMHVCVALELYKQFPRGSPNLYTNLRMALNTNATFTHFMVRAGTFDINTSGKSKVAADAFETLIAAYYFENGFNALCTWVASILKPLIAVAQKAFTDFNDQCVLTKGQKRIRPMDSIEHYRDKMARTSSLPRSKFRPNRTTIRPRDMIRSDIKMASVPLSQNPSANTGSSLRSRYVEVIDLTADTDSDDEWVDCDDSIGKCVPDPRYTVKSPPPCSLPRSRLPSLFPPPPQNVVPLINNISQPSVSAGDGMIAPSSTFSILRDTASRYARGNTYTTQVERAILIAETASSSKRRAHLATPEKSSSGSLAASIRATPHGRLDNSNSALPPELRSVTNQVRTVSLFDGPQSNPPPVHRQRIPSLHPTTRSDCRQMDLLASASGPLDVTMSSSPVLGGPDNPISIDDDDDDIDMAH